ncbi:SCO family protein [Domibacillus sp. A3M-37]|uniref:SCO family protein n=1 Tax=Domibacillus sp. A3M-37 TaxID=2962037 RepID=UPI0020B6AD38|nr:SCO family protein [Domibacillus sp. A3M-37]MCP3764610.1 SCO family protein [Domibacillus sp. A3M-37]
MISFRSIFIAAAILIMLSACSNRDFQGNMDVEVQNFTNVNQNGEEVSLADLEGKVWLANFIFTSCTTVCPPMTRNMSDVQDMLNEEGVENYEIVSFSIDPARDTPEALKEYISHYEADESNWQLLTGYTEEEIGTFAEKSFQAVAIPDPNSDQFVHGTSFYLVDQEGKVVKSYQGNKQGSEEVPFDEIVQDVKQLSAQ